jgi:hypothetical protein
MSRILEREYDMNVSSNWEREGREGRRGKSQKARQKPRVTGLVLTPPPLPTPYLFPERSVKRRDLGQVLINLILEARLDKHTKPVLSSAGHVILRYILRVTGKHNELAPQAHEVASL